MFAKIFNTQYGQVLVVADADANNVPQVTTTFWQVDLGLVSTSTKFTDDEDGWDAQELHFAAVTSDYAERTVEKQLAKLITPAK